MRRSSSQSGLALTLLLLVLVAAACGGWWYWKNRNAGEVSYLTLPITRGDIVQAVTATGTLNPVVNVQVGSQISGIIQKLNADFNTPVKAGQIVAQMDPATFQAALMQAEGELANAEANLELAQLNEKRARALVTRNAAPQATLDQATATLHQAQAQVMIRKGALQKARVDLSRCTIYSPVDGIVISRDVDVGQTVAASFSAPVIFTIANDLTKMQINASVAEADVGNVETGQEVDFAVDAFPYRTFHGKVTQVRNAATTVQNVVTYDAIIAVDNPDLKLKPGMTANASIIIARRRDALQLSAAALRFRMPESEEEGAARSTPGSGSRAPADKTKKRRNQRTITLLRDGKPQPVTVTIGISDGVHTEVLEGLQEGDLAITGIVDESLHASSGARGSSNPFTGRGRRRF